MANKRIKNLTEKTSLASGDYIPIDNDNGTKKVNASKIMTPLSSAQTDATRALNMIRSTSSFPTGDAYSTTSSYKVGDMAIYNNTLYRCKNACSPASWSVNANNFEAISLASALTDLNNDLSKKWTQIMAIATSEDAKSWNYSVELSKYKEIRFIVAGPDSNFNYLVAVTTLNSDYIKTMIDQTTTFYLWYGNLVGASYGLGGNLAISATSIEKGFIFLNNGNSNKRAAYVMVLGR